MEEEKFFEKVNEIIQSYHLKTVHLVLEVTERAAMRVSETLSQDVKILQNYGIQFSLDDFGMGHNSILYLQEGIFSEVKLDGQLVSQIRDQRALQRNHLQHHPYGPEDSDSGL